MSQQMNIGSDGKIATLDASSLTGNRSIILPDTGGALDGEQLITLTSAYALTNGTALQKLFNAPTNGSLTVVGNTTYFFDTVFSVTGLSSSSHTVGFGFAGTAVLTRQAWEATVLAAGALGTVATAQMSFQTATAAITSSTTTTGLLAHVSGKIVVGTGGTLIPSVQQNTASAAATVGNDSYFRIWAVGSNTVQSVGNWS